MNIEIANKLVKLRKQNGLSQEELADKLGLSRQAVSKWERAEASPDTDNLICLAKLYNISLDELLSTEDSPETIIKEQVKDKEDKSYVHIGKDGIHIADDEDEVRINKEGIHLKDGSEEVVINGHEIKKDHKYNDPIKRRRRQIYYALSGILMSLALIAYIVLGATLNMWGTMWILFFVPDIIVSSIKCIMTRRAHHFNITFAALFSFFLVCLVLFPDKSLWHPMWVVFLAIPIYYILVTRIETLLIKEDDREDDD